MELDLRLNQIIWDLRNKLEDAKQGCRQIYLAQPRNDLLRAKCQWLKRALHQERYAVLPSEFVTLRTLESKIRKWVEDAELSIHLRSVPPDPLSERQLNIARECGRQLTVLDGPFTEQDLPDILAHISEKLSSAGRPAERYFVYDYHSDEEQVAVIYPIEECGRRLTRNPTAQEWQAYLPNVPYERTCPNVPPRRNLRRDWTKMSSATWL